MKTLHLFIYLFIASLNNLAFAQMPTLNNPNNSFVGNLAYENNEAGFIWWKCDSMLTNKLFTVYKNQTGLSTKDSMALERKWDDLLVCEKHSHYQLFHNGLPVEGSEYREHYNPQTDVLSLSNGRFV